MTSGTTGSPALPTPVPACTDIANSAQQETCTTASNSQCATSLNCVGGVCAPPANQVPAASNGTVGIAVGVLIGLGALGLWRRRRTPR